MARKGTERRFYAIEADVGSAVVLAYASLPGLL